MDYFNIIEL